MRPRESTASTSGSRRTPSRATSTCPSTTRATTRRPSGTRRTSTSRARPTAARRSGRTRASRTRSPTSTTARESSPAPRSTTGTSRATTRASSPSAGSRIPSGPTAGATPTRRRAVRGISRWKRSSPPRCSSRIGPPGRAAFPGPPFSAREAVALLENLVEEPAVLLVLLDEARVDVGRADVAGIRRDLGVLVHLRDDDVESRARLGEHLLHGEDALRRLHGGGREVLGGVADRGAADHDRPLGELVDRGVRLRRLL